MTPTISQTSTLTLSNSQSGVASASATTVATISNPKKTSIRRTTKPPLKTTQTSQATESKRFKYDCNSTESCLEFLKANYLFKGQKPCYDFNDLDCIRLLADSCGDSVNNRNCNQREFYTFYFPKKTATTTQYAYVLTPLGAPLAAVKIPANTFPPGTVLEVQFYPNNEATAMQDNEYHNCEASDFRLSYLTAFESPQSKITHLSRNIEVAMPVVSTDSYPDDYQDRYCQSSSSGNDQWECDMSESRVDHYSRYSVSVARRSLNHLTSFAVLTNYCSPLWIIALALVGAIPVFLLVSYATAKTQRGRRFLYGYTGSELNTVMNRISRHPSMYPQNSTPYLPTGKK